MVAKSVHVGQLNLVSSVEVRVDPIIAGAAIGAAGSLVGGQMNRRAYGDAAASSARYQREFAKKGLQWRVADAKAAGISPLAALGFSGANFTPMGADSSMGDAVANMGQNVGRAVSAMQTADERQFGQEMRAEQLKEARLRNSILEHQVTTIRGNGTGEGVNQPPFPGSSYKVPGQTQSGLVETQPLKRTAVNPDAPHQMPGSVGSVGWEYIGEGMYAPIQAPEQKQATEDSPSEMAWFWRNNVLPTLGRRKDPPPFKSSGFDGEWVWNSEMQAYAPATKWDVPFTRRHKLYEKFFGR